MRRATWVVDVLAVVVFVVVGRASHHHGETPRGVGSTLWPFAVGLLVARLAVRRLRPLALGTGVVVCLVTVAVGMVLRVAAGQGTAAAFIGVAVGFLGAVMVGGRLALGAISRRQHTLPVPVPDAGDR